MGFKEIRKTIITKVADAVIGRIKVDVINDPFEQRMGSS
jgi:hypothetical protein